MATLSEKLRACLTLNPEAAAAIYVDGSRALVLDANDLAGIADALSGRDSLVRERDEAIAAADDIRIHNARTEELAAERDAAKRDLHQATSKLAAVESELSAIRADRAAIFDLLAKARAELAEARKPSPEALPTREDLETVLTVAVGEDAVAIVRGPRWASLVEDGGTYSIVSHSGRSTNMPFRDAIAEAAHLIREGK